MPANARNTMRVVNAEYTRETNVREPVLNELPSGRSKAASLAATRRSCNPPTVAGGSPWFS